MKCPLRVAASIVEGKERAAEADGKCPLNAGSRLEFSQPDACSQHFKEKRQQQAYRSE
jgi:hypothetical protein